jgi:hypothetical protein
MWVMLSSRANNKQLTMGAAHCLRTYCPRVHGGGVLARRSCCADLGADLQAQACPQVAQGPQRLLVVESPYLVWIRRRCHTRGKSDGGANQRVGVGRIRQALASGDMHQAAAGVVLELLRCRIAARRHHLQGIRVSTAASCIHRQAVLCSRACCSHTVVNQNDRRVPGIRHLELAATCAAGGAGGAD